MGRRRLPSACVDAFAKTVGDSLALYRAHLALSARRSCPEGLDPLTIRNDAAAMSTLRLGIAWEKFLDDWLVTVVTSDPSKLLERTTAEVQLTAAAQTLGLRLAHPGQLTQDQVRRVLDPKRQNVAFPEHGTLRNDQGRWLSPAWKVALKANITRREEQLHQALRSIRNALAHQSLGSYDGLTADLAAISAHYPELGWRQSVDVGPAGLLRHLRSGDRVPRLHRAFLDIAGRFPTEPHCLRRGTGDGEMRPPRKEPR
ncbi:hypothetical protein [Blastococcus sp. SYSU DS1024]